MRSRSYSACHSWTSVLVCFSQVNWTQFLDRNVSGGVEVEPKSSILYSTAIVFSKVRTFCFLSTLHNITQSKFRDQVRVFCLSVFCEAPRCLTFLMSGGTFCLCCSCWSTMISMTPPSRPPPSSHCTICRTSTGLL